MNRSLRQGFGGSFRYDHDKRWILDQNYSTAFYLKKRKESACEIYKLYFANTDENDSKFGYGFFLDTDHVYKLSLNKKFLEDNCTI